MRHIFIILTMLISISIPFSEPCKDSTYVELCKKDLNALSQNELKYYLHYKGWCEKSKDELPEETVKAVANCGMEKKTKIVLFSIAGLLVANTLLSVVLNVNSLSSK